MQVLQQCTVQVCCLLLNDFAEFFELHFEKIAENWKNRLQVAQKEKVEGEKR